MRLKKKIVILAAAFCVVWAAFSFPLRFEDKVAEPDETVTAPENLQPFTAAELDLFLPVWSKFLHTDLNARVKQISLASPDSKTQNMPAEVQAWLSENGWDARRFFRIERRLPELMRAVELERRIEGYEQLAGNVSGMEAMIEDSRRSLKMLHGRLNQQELAIVRTRYDAVKDVMDKSAAS